MLVRGHNKFLVINSTMTAKACLAITINATQKNNIKPCAVELPHTVKFTSIHVQSMWDMAVILSHVSLSGLANVLKIEPITADMAIFSTFRVGRSHLAPLS